MAKKKKNKVLPLIAMGAACAVFLGAYLWLRTQNEQNTGTSDPTDTSVTMISERDPATITKLSYTYGGDTVRLSYSADSGTWSYAADPAFPLEQSYPAQMAAAISSIGVYRTLETADTSAFGFDDPACEITVSYTDGQSFHYAIGDVNAVSGNQYFLDRDSGTVYMISTALLPYFRYTAEDLFLYDTLPADIEETYIDAATLTAGGSEAVRNEAEDLSEIYKRFLQLAPVEFADWSQSEEAKSSFGIGESTLRIDYKRKVTTTDTSGTESTARIPASYTVQFGTPTEDGKIPYTVGQSGVIYLIDDVLYDEICALFISEE